VNPPEPPYSASRGEVDEPDFLLTHAEWHPSSMHGIDRGCPETGVRRKVDGQIVKGSFELIQHGWWNFDAAGALILRALRKGWDTYRISALMNWMRETRRHLPRGRTL
jgi:hypothetical protein